MTPSDKVIAALNLPSMWDQLDGTAKIDGAMTRAARLRKDLTRWEREGVELCRRMEESHAEAHEQGIAVDQRLSPMVEAFYRALLAKDGQDRVELVTIQDAPIPPVTEDNE